MLGKKCVVIAEWIFEKFVFKIHRYSHYNKIVHRIVSKLYCTYESVFNVFIPYELPFIYIDDE